MSGSSAVEQVSERCHQLSKMIEKMSEDLNYAQSQFNKSKQEFHKDGNQAYQSVIKQDNFYTKKLDKVREPLSLIFKFRKLQGLSIDIVWFVSLCYGENIIQSNQCRGPDINEKLKVQIDPPDKATSIKVEIWKQEQEQIMFDSAEIDLSQLLQNFKNNDKLTNFSINLKKNTNLSFLIDASMHGVGVKVWLDAYNRFINGIPYPSQVQSLADDKANDNNEFLINSYDENQERQRVQENKLMETKKIDEEQRQVTALKFIRQTNQLIQELEELEQQNQQEQKQKLLQQQLLLQQQQHQQQLQQQLPSAPQKEESSQQQNGFKATEITQGNNDQYENSFLDESTVKLLEEVSIKKGQQQQQPPAQNIQDQQQNIAAQRKQISQGSLQLQQSFNLNEQPLKLHEMTEEEKERQQQKLQDFKKWEEKIKEEEKQKDQKQKQKEIDQKNKQQLKNPSSIQLSIKQLTGIINIKGNLSLEISIRLKNEIVYKYDADNIFSQANLNNKSFQFNQEISVPYDYQKIKMEKQADLENYYLIFNFLTKDSKQQQQHNQTVGWLAFPLFKNKRLNIGIFEMNIYKPPLQNKEIQDLKAAVQLQMQEKFEFQLKKIKSSDEIQDELLLLDQTEKDLLRSQSNKQKQQFETQEVYFIRINIIRLIKARYQSQQKKTIDDKDLDIGIEIAVKKKNELVFQRLVNDDLFQSPDDQGTIEYDYNVNLPIDYKKIKLENSSELNDYNIIIELIQRRDKKQQSSYAWISIPLFNINGKLNSGQQSLNMLKPPVQNKSPLDQKVLSKLELESKIEILIESIKQEQDDQIAMSLSEQQKKDTEREQKKKPKENQESPSLLLNIISLLNIKSIQNEMRIEITIKKKNEMIYRKIVNDKFIQIEKKQTQINFNINLIMPFDYNNIFTKDSPEELKEYYILFEFISRREMMQSTFGWFTIPLFGSNGKLNLGQFSEKLIRAPVQINTLKKIELSEFLEFQLQKNEQKQQENQKKQD